MPDNSRDIRKLLDRSISPHFCLAAPEKRGAPAGRRGRFVTQAAARETPPLDWLAGDGVQGVGMGEKIRNGRVESALSLRVYVDRKRPLSELENPVPPVLETEAAGPVQTDVVEIGALTMDQAPARRRPVAPGCSLGHVDVKAGTFGCVVRRSGAPGKKFILSNAHVIADCGRASIGSAVVQPAVMDGGAAEGDTVAVLSSFVAYNDLASGLPNLVDAAIAEIRLGVDEVSPVISELNRKPERVFLRPRRGMRVQKVGRTSGHTWGRIIDIDFQGFVSLDGAAGGASVFFRDQVLCTNYSKPGDSGALVLTSGGLALGLHFAGAEQASLFNRIDHVFSALDIELDA